MTEIFYKATRPDGTDFRTGTVDYAAYLESGQPLPEIELPEGKKRQCCTGTVYHASIVPAETLIGGSWPCRLFEVTGKPVAEGDSKRGFATLRVVREIEAWRALGPNGEAVAALITRVRQMTAIELSEVAAGYAVWNVARGAVWDAVWDVARGAARAAAMAAAGDAAWYAAWNVARYAVWGVARGAAEDAAIAFAIRDLISAEHFDTLTRPLLSVIGTDW